MNEEFLYYLWKYRLYDNDVFTTSGLAIEIVAPGQHNQDAGPDFINARIRIDNTLWAGNVEIHVKSSDWFNHQHQSNPSFSNIILHVVFEHDKDVLDVNNQPIATLELKNNFDERIYKKYFYYLNNKNHIPCQKDFAQINPIVLKSWTERLFVERLQRKSEDILHYYHQNKANLEETFYQQLAGNFGFKLNDEPFRLLARMLPLHILGKHQNSLFQLEALLYGVSGLVTDRLMDDYPRQLFKESEFLRIKYSIPKLEPHLWKFMRLRPANFPTVRISQFARLIHKSGNLLSTMLEIQSLNELTGIFTLEASEYWKDHFLFDKTAPLSTKSMGTTSFYNIMINTVTRFIFFYGQMKSEQKYIDRAIDFMLQIPPESNHIIGGWEKLGVRPENALETQALIELLNSYCKLKKCLNCSIGLALFGSGN